MATIALLKGVNLGLKYIFGVKSACGTLGHTRSLSHADQGLTYGCIIKYYQGASIALFTRYGIYGCAPLVDGFGMYNPPINDIHLKAN